MTIATGSYFFEISDGIKALAKKHDLSIAILSSKTFITKNDAEIVLTLNIDGIHLDMTARITKPYGCKFGSLFDRNDIQNLFDADIKKSKHSYIGTSTNESFSCPVLTMEDNNQVTDCDEKYETLFNKETATVDNVKEVPPRNAEVLLRWIVHRDRYDDVMASIDDRFESDKKKFGFQMAKKLYWKEVYGEFWPTIHFAFGRLKKYLVQ